MKHAEILETLIERYPALAPCRDDIAKATDLMIRNYGRGGCAFVAGNGGSAADSEHLVGELMKSFMLDRSLNEATKSRLSSEYGERGEKIAAQIRDGLPAISLPSLISASTAIINDMDADLLFAQMMNALSKENDTFIGISTSGNSKNVINAMMVAKAKGVSVIGLTGKNACQMDSVCDVVVHVPETETYKIQELHLPVYHAVCAMLEYEYWG